MTETTQEISPNMPKNKTKKKEETTPDNTEENLVLSKSPRYPNLTRKAHKLWNKHYRINYHDGSVNNAIIYSYFAEVLSENKVKFNWSITVGEEMKDLEEVK